MRSPIEQLQRSGLRLCVVHVDDPSTGLVPMVFGLRRIAAGDSMRLMRAGIESVRRDAEAKEREALALARAEEAGELDEVRAKLDARKAATVAAEAAALEEEPEQVERMMSAFDGVVMDVVRSSGIASSMMEEGLLPPETRPSDVCLNVGGVADQPIYLQPLRWTKAGTDHTADTVPIDFLPERVRVALGTLAVKAFLPSAVEVEPFRDRPRDAGGGGPVGAEVRAAPVDAAAGARSSRRKARSGGRG